MRLVAASVFAGDSRGGARKASSCSSVHRLGAGQVVTLLQRYLWKMLFVLLLTLISSVGLAQSDPAPAPQRNFMIFFKWNSAELTTRDKETIADAAMHAKRLIDRQGTVSVRGYVDTSLSQQRSSALSERMARVRP